MVHKLQKFTEISFVSCVKAKYSQISYAWGDIPSQTHANNAIHRAKWNKLPQFCPRVLCLETRAFVTFIEAEQKKMMLWHCEKFYSFLQLFEKNSSEKMSCSYHTILELLMIKVGRTSLLAGKGSRFPEIHFLAPVQLTCARISICKPWIDPFSNSFPDIHLQTRN